ncbi:MAG TPA: Ig-like domain-containing protein, partial [Acidobacteriaceae bacterium]
MIARRRVAAFLLVLGSVLGAALVGCGNPNGLDSISVTPASETINTGQTAQLTAIGTFGNAKHPNQQNVTTGVTWTSNKTAVATVDKAGLVTAVGAGTATITATAQAFNGQTSSSALVTVASPGGGTGGTGGSGGGILSLTIIPSGIVFGTLGDSGQFLAIGTFSTAPTVRDLTNSVTWLTSEPNKYPVTNNNSAAPGGGTENGGVVSDYEASNGPVGAIITAEAKDSNGSIATATANVGCPYVLPNPPSTPGSCFNSVPTLLTTLTFYNEGLDTSDWEITAPSATGTPKVIHCGPGWIKDGGSDSVCTATYPINTTVTLTAPARSDVKFGGWSSNCTNTGTISET